MGRPTKLTPETIEDFCTAVVIGCTMDAAAAYAGIAYSTYRKWAIDGEAAQAKKASGKRLTEHERQLIEFLEAIEAAQAEAKMNWQQTIDKAARVDPVWAWKMLQVRDPANYAPPPTRAEVSGPAGGPLKTEVEHRGQVHGSVEHVAAVVAALAGVGAIQLAGVSGSDDAEDDGLHTP